MIKFSSQLGRRAIVHKNPGLCPPSSLLSANFSSVSMEMRKDVLGKGGINSLSKETMTAKMLMPIIWVDLVWHRDVIQRADSPSPDTLLVGEDEGLRSLLSNLGTGGQHNTMMPDKFIRPKTVDLVNS